MLWLAEIKERNADVAGDYRAERQLLALSFGLALDHCGFGVHFEGGHEVAGRLLVLTQLQIGANHLADKKENLA